MKTPDETARELQRTIEGEKRAVVDGIIKIPLVAIGDSLRREGKDKGDPTKYGIIGSIIKFFKRRKT